MKAFKEFLKNIEKKYPLFQDKEGYNIANVRALKVGWREALEMVLKSKNLHLKSILIQEIKKELEDGD